MRRYDNPTRKALAAWLPTLLLVLSVAVPVLERAEFAHEPVVESEHNPATCPPAHDHTVCTQVGANLSLATAPIFVDHTHPIVRASIPVQAPATSSAVFLDGHRSRAPPSA